MYGTGQKPSYEDWQEFMTELKEAIAKEKEDEMNLLQEEWSKAYQGHTKWRSQTHD